MANRGVEGCISLLCLSQGWEGEGCEATGEWLPNTPSNLPAELAGRQVVG